MTAHPLDAETVDATAYYAVFHVPHGEIRPSTVSSPAR